MDKPKGGRGKKAPYETTCIRVPVSLKPKIQKMIEDYRLSLDSDIKPQNEMIDSD